MTPQRQFMGSLVLLGLSTAYLVVELVFNAALLNTAGGLEIDDDQLRQIEYFGRSVSGAGFALFVLGILSSFPPPRFARTLMLTAVVLAWNTMFFGQKAVIDHWLIDNSSWEQRLDAQYMNLLKLGLGRGLIRIEGAPFDPQRTDLPEQRSFLVLLGGLVMHAPQFLAQAREQKSEIIARVVQDTGNTDLEDAYREYLRQGERFEALWQEYRKASERYDEIAAGAAREARARWAETYADAAARWESYLKAREDYQTSMEELARELSPRLERYFDMRGACRDDDCRQRLDARYRQEIRRATGRDIPFDTWCWRTGPGLTDPLNAGVRKVSEGVHKALTTVFSGVAKVLGGKVESSSTTEKEPMMCSTRPDFVADRLIRFNTDTFAERSGGYPYDLSDRDAFMAHPATARKIRDRARREDLELPQDWRLNQDSVFIDAVRRNIMSGANSNWSREVRGLLGTEVPPRLGYADFIQQLAIQDRIQTRMGNNYRPGMHFEMSEAEFKRRVLDPKVEARVNAYIEDLETAGEEFANGGAREEQGKRYLRAVVIPPIALALSLFFAVVTLAKSLYSLGTLTLIQSKGVRNLPRPVRAILMAGVAGLSVAVLVLPPLMFENRLSRAPAFAYFADQAKASTSPVVWTLAQYTLRVEPVIYPLGQALLPYAPLPSEWRHTTSPTS